MLLNQPMTVVPDSVRRAALVVAAELAVTLAAWAALRTLDLHQSPLPALLLAWGACFVLYTAPVQDRLARPGRSHAPSLVLTSAAVWIAMTTTELPSIYPVVIGALAMEVAQRDASTRTALTGLAAMFLGTAASQVAVHHGWVSSVIGPVPSDHLAVVLVTVGGVVLVRGVALARRSASTRAALVQEQRRRHEELQHAAAHDSLTGLLSRRGLEPVARAASAQARPGRGVALMFLDLDGFKAVNDSHGHGVGDELLACAAARFAGALGPDAVLARMGGDEFVAVLREMPSPAAAVARARAVQDSLGEEFRLDEPGIPVRIGVSVGLAWAEQPTAVDTLMRDADRAMYRDKRCREGDRRRVIVLDDSDRGVFQTVEDLAQQP
ncbi:GGDEF domain-containing protein [Kineosporia succinea]|uniref:Diguanylate cyclase (GGDEF)-like protein n=1 Tax=Kineosporia succinea TaxID=84632 RepID=A0ABT9NWT8_9ACTN|nr:GGDEF domain-containing protein [Kineosporia succinea]MDP9824893.1 diguanylate cyclase (GGDEF)-like protein [Kineosporia succinea]